MSTSLTRTDRAFAAGTGVGRPITVGVDDSVGAAAALGWAADEAVARDVPLHIVYAWSWQRLEPWSAALDRRVIADLRAEGDLLVSRSARRATTHGVSSVETEVVEGYAPDVLTGLADSAGLIVIGSHRLRSPHRVALGSVANAVAHRASCPVVVVWGPTVAAPDTPVVIGVAGDVHDADVLNFGFAYAQRHRLPVHIVHCWLPAPLADHRLPIPDKAYRWLVESIASWRNEYAEVEVETSVLRNHPVEGLIGAAHGQSLLVVGRRGTSRFKALLGSTSLAAIHHAECPVAVIPPQLQTPQSHAREDDMSTAQSTASASSDTAASAQTATITFTERELILVQEAVHSFFDDFGHDQADVRGELRRVLDKVAAARGMTTT